MQGDARLRSLVRLTLWGAFLAALWLLLTPSGAQASERPEKDSVTSLVKSLAPAVASEESPAKAGTTAIPPRKSLVGNVLRTATAPAKPLVPKITKPVQKTLAPASSAVDSVVAPVRPVLDSVEPVVTPAVRGVRAVTTTTVDRVSEVVVDTAAAVPVLEEPVRAVTEVVEEVVDAAPVVGADPVVDVPVIAPGPPVDDDQDGPGADASSGSPGGQSRPPAPNPSDSTSPDVESPAPSAPSAAAAAGAAGPRVSLGDLTDRLFVGAPTRGHGDAGAATSAAHSAAPQQDLQPVSPLAPKPLGGQPMAPAPAAPAPASSGANTSAQQGTDLYADLPYLAPRRTQGCLTVTTHDRRVPTSISADPGSRPG